MSDALLHALTAPPPAPKLPAPVARIDIDPDAMARDLTRLVLTLVEFLRRLMEAQAVRRMEAGTITAAQAEAVGGGLMASRDAVLELCERLKIEPGSLNLDLGPLGRLL
jgi:hypothetical protein